MVMGNISVHGAQSTAAAEEGGSQRQRILSEVSSSSFAHESASAHALTAASSSPVWPTISAKRLFVMVIAQIFLLASAPAVTAFEAGSAHAVYQLLHAQTSVVHVLSARSRLPVCPATSACT